MQPITKKQAKKLAKKLDLKYTKKAPNNGYSGYSNCQTKLYHTSSGSVYIITTCGNCGSGSWIKVNNLIKTK